MKPIDLHLINAEGKFKEAINHAFDLGWEASEERIIKLLEDTQNDWRCREGCCECFGWDLDTPINQLDYLIALIKGEQNG